jgi:hypothetical protein
MLKIEQPYLRLPQRHLDAQARYDDYNEVYKTPQGKRVLDDLLYYAAVDRTAFCMKADNQTFFNLGKQSMGYHIMNVLNQEPSPQQTTTIGNKDE